MKTIDYKNLQVNFSDGYADVSGDALLTIPSDLVPEFLLDVEGCQYMDYELEVYAESEEAEFVCSGADAQIIFISWALEQKENISFDYEGDSIFWLFHDLHHAMNDVTGIEIYVDGHIEAERHYQAIGLLKERGLLHVVSVELFQTINKEFRERAEHDSTFDGSFDFEKAMELAEIKGDVYYECPECYMDEIPEEKDGVFSCECGHEGEEYEFKHEGIFEEY